MDTLIFIAKLTVVCVAGFSVGFITCNHKLAKKCADQIAKDLGL